MSPIERTIHDRRPPRDLFDKHTVTIEDDYLAIR